MSAVIDVYSKLVGTLRIGVVGPEFQSSVICKGIARVGHIDSVYLGDSLGSVNSSLLRSVDLVHFYYCPVADSLLSQWKLFVPAVVGTPVIFHWIGSDVSKALSHMTGRAVAKVCKWSRLIKLHLAQAPWLAEELSTMRLRAKVFPLIPELGTDLLPLPEHPSVLIYLPERRFEFYGGLIVEKLATEFPEVRFVVVGSYRQTVIPNLSYLPWQREMRRVWEETGILLRVAKHDGLPWMVLEALARGRQVIFSHDFPHCYKAKTYDEIKASLSGILAIYRANLDGADFVRSHFNERVQFDNLISVYRGVLSNHRLDPNTFRTQGKWAI